MQKTKSQEKLEGKTEHSFSFLHLLLAASQLIFFLQSWVSCWQGLCPPPGLTPHLLSTLFKLHTMALPTLVDIISMVSSSCGEWNPSLQQQRSTSEQKMMLRWGSFPTNLLTVQLSFKIRIMPYNCFIDGYSSLDLLSEIWKRRLLLFASFLF